MYTHISELETAAANANAAVLATSKNGTATNGTNDGLDEFFPGTKVKKWRTIPGPAHVKMEGKDCWICPHHKRTEAPIWDGLCCTHKPNRCFRNPNNKKKDTPADGASSTAASSENSTSKLTLKENLKAALSSELCMSNDDIDKLLEHAEGQGN